MGNSFGQAGDAVGQRQILRDALLMVADCEQAGELRDLPYEWHEPIAYRPKKRDPSYQKNT